MILEETNFKLNAPSVIFDEIDGEVLVINLKVGHYFRLRDSAARLWSLIIEGYTLIEINELFNIPKPIQSEIFKFISELLALELIVQTTKIPNAPRSFEPIEFYELLIEKFTDLEDILGLDPIHEVDPSKGWPFSGSSETTN